MAEPYMLTAVEARTAIATGALSALALVESCLARIRVREPVVEAWAHLDTDTARRQARAADEARRSGATLGVLHGVPVAIKDIIDTAELPTEHGTSIFKGRRPATDAEVVRRLKRAGAVILGKTVTTELAFFGPGKTRNPANPAHTPGGSSSGSAAAVADFHVPLALGTQTAGSIIRPASYCGVIGFKPTFGRVPRDGVLEQSSPLDTIGGYARTPSDIALLMAVLEGSALPARLAVETRPLRLAFVRSPAWNEGEPLMQAAFARFVAENRDIVAEAELPPDFADTGSLQRAVQYRDIARTYGPISDAHPGQISAKLAEVIGIGRQVTDAEYAAALARREPLAEALAPLLARCDAILTPASTGPAPKGLASTGSPAFNFLWTYLGLPAVCLPLLEADGLPLGVQLVGARGADARLLAVAEALIRHVAGRGGV